MFGQEEEDDGEEGSIAVAAAAPIALEATGAEARAEAAAGAAVDNEEGPLPWVERDYTPISTAHEWEQGRCDILIKVRVRFRFMHSWFYGPNNLSMQAMPSVPYSHRRLGCNLSGV